MSTRIQFYPSDKLKEKLNSNSDKLGVGISVLVNDILNKHYGLIPPNSLTDSEIQKKVLEEVEAYVKNKTDDKEFDLNEASSTFRKIDMTYGGKPQALKAQIGRAFAKCVGTGAFAQVEQVFLPNGNPKRTVGNRAALYRINSGNR